MYDGAHKRLQKLNSLYANLNSTKRKLDSTTYEKVRVHAEWGNNRKSSIANSTKDSVQSVR